MKKQLISLLVILIPAVVFSQGNGKFDIDPKASVHPSVIMEGTIKIGPYTEIGPGTILTGDIEIGAHTIIRCNVTIRGNNKIGSYVHIYDNVNIEGGRPGGYVGSATNGEPDKSIIGDYCWINHGSVMHGTQMKNGSAIGLGAACNYNTVLEEGSILADGSATNVDQVIPAKAFAQGVPAEIKARDIDDEFVLKCFGLIPREWIKYADKNLVDRINKSLENK